MTTDTELRGNAPGRHAPHTGPGAELEREIELELAEAAPALAWPIDKICSTRYAAIRSSGTRHRSAVELIVVHCTEGQTAKAAAVWFTNRACQGSAHVIVDSGECYRTLPPSLIPWGAPGVNGNGWHIELAGFASWTRAQWMARERMIERAAYKIALHARLFEIPLKRLTDAELHRGRRGLIDHRQASRVYGGTHWDPGEGFPWPVLLEHARLYAIGLSR